MMLLERKCEPVPAGAKPLGWEKVEELMQEIPGWTVRNSTIEREFSFQSFREAVGFVNLVAAVAEEEDHHPDICIYYRRVRLSFTTHKIGGLSGNDFIMAAKTGGLVHGQ